MSFLLAPPPSSLKTHPGRWQPGAENRIAILGEAGGILRKACRRFARQAKKHSGKHFSVADDSGTQEAAIRINCQTAGFPSQGYRLKITPDEVKIDAGGEPGVFYALQTLRQILMQSPESAPCLEIEDAPAFPHRGVMLDISRCKVPKLETLFHLIEMFASFKINQLQLYTEHTFAFEIHQIVWADASPLTAKNVQRLDRYCRDRYIELVPNLNSFGHFDRWLRHPEYRRLAECPGGFTRSGGHASPWGSTLKPDRESLRFLDRLYEEFLPNFSSRNFNVGCDETWELGTGWCKPLADKTSAQEVYFDFLLKILELAGKHGRQPQFWADIILQKPELVSHLPENATGMIWGYEADHPFEEQCAVFAKTGKPFQVVPGTSSWGSIGGRIDNALANLENAARHGKQFGAAGYLNTDWGDAGHHQMLPISYPGFVYGASQSWNPEKTERGSLADVLNRFVFQDATGHTARILLDLGRTPNLTKKYIRNGTLLNKLLFSKPEALENNLEGVTVGELRAVCSHLLQVGERLPLAAPQCPDGGLVVQELYVTAGMLTQAARCGLARLTRNPPDLTHRRRKMMQLIHDFEALWLARNRHGGLHESSQRLRDVLAAYR